MTFDTPLTRQLGIRYPIIGGAMYPCSNPELVAAVSKAGGIGIVQPISMTYVHGHDYAKGLDLIRSITPNPIGVNVLVEKSSQVYEDRMKKVVDTSLEKGVRFFITALGNPSWVLKKVKPLGGIVYHDVTNRKWAEKAVEYGVDGLICVNNRAGGHAGEHSPEELMFELKSFGLPLICAGGIGGRNSFIKALEMGYAGVQIGTRLIATKECNAHIDYKNSILKASAQDIVLTEKISGVPVSVIKTPYVEAMGLKASGLARYLLRGRKTKHWMRLFYTLKSAWALKRSLHKGASYQDFWQAGKSVEEINSILSVDDVFREFVG
jgi:nitronate monooxygenase